MPAVPRTLLLVTIILTCAQMANAQQPAQQPVTITITEPAVVSVEDLFKQADTVALVKIVSGDDENYRTAICKGKVIESFKGAAAGETVYIGPYIGYRLGWEYVLFLRDAKELIAPKTTSAASYGTIHYAEVFEEGYSAMETSYECVFEGKDLAQQCDYGVRVCTDYILFPKSTPTFPPETEYTSFGCRWVRKKVFISLLGKLAHSKQ